ncbi:transglycosylase SLT domain-containing protein [Yersinia intermedia]|uniref:transglycosylase SLT domain-containing protein n=1 Tax=Yersinia intermedia TaxID=631 RepID=UPI0005DF7426|nr:transglycosylase SLT domain-containing protein [Yersinia intermedia]CND00292.1 transglycosylase SLT domain-containing protein [Yersinia intermedia]CNH23047.1 transglycosylase SLT domain-containing protein [Yersinia intermedia]
MKKTISILMIIFSGSSVAQDCFERAGRDYRIEPTLLRAVAFRESSFRPKAMNIVSSEKYAIGMMQIHSQNFLHLSQFGITPGNLYHDSCLNIYTGAYYLAIAFKRWGYNWRAVGAYNAGFKDSPEQEQKRYKYASEIQTIYKQIKFDKNRIAD